MLNNGDLAEVTWEQRETEGEPRYDDVQTLPAFPYARYAELLGLRGLQVGRSGRRSRRVGGGALVRPPFVLEAIVDPDVPLLPPFPVGEEKLASFRRGLEQEGPSGRHALELLELQAAQEARRRDRP